MYDEDLANLEDWLRRLKVEFDIFFNGHRKRPPDDLKMKLERLAKKLAEASDLSFQQRFRYNTLVARYYVYKDLWRRTLLDREAGKDALAHAVNAQPEAAPEILAPGRIALQVSLADPEAEQDRVRELYQGLLSAWGGNSAAASAISFERFQSYLVHQTVGLRNRYHCDRVIFILEVEDDAVRFKAKPEPKEPGGSVPGPGSEQPPISGNAPPSA